MHIHIENAQISHTYTTPPSVMAEWPLHPQSRTLAHQVCTNQCQTSGMYTCKHVQLIIL